jgi:flagellar biosynthesis chaperone FliJ
MSKRYPLQKLLQLREHRAENARRAVLECQHAVQQCREACTRIEGEIDALHAERNDQRRQLMNPPPPGTSWPMALAQREAHIDWLAAQAEAARQRLLQAQQKLRVAEQALADARTAYLRAKARQEALEKRKDFWRGEQHAIEVRSEESATADLLMSRHAASKTH